MEKISFERILDELTNKIDAYTTDIIRADILKRSLEIKKYNLKNSKETLTEKDNIQLLKEIEFAIKLVDNYIQNNSFSIDILTQNKKEIDRLNEIKKALLTAVNKTNEEPFYF